MDIKFRVQTTIQKPVEQVFDAVSSPDKISAYFATGGSSGPLVEGSTVIWNFSDCEGDFEVKVDEVKKDQLIVFRWESGSGDETTVRMNFEPVGNGETMVTISESGWRQDQSGLDSSYDNCGGWMQMTCCLKAYLEYGINLREGFFKHAAKK